MVTTELLPLLGLGKNAKKIIQHTGDEAYNFFMAVLFSDNQLKIYDYNRVIKDLNGLTAFELIGKLNDLFKLLDKSDQPIRPSKGRIFQFIWIRIGIILLFRISKDLTTRQRILMFPIYQNKS